MSCWLTICRTTSCRLNFFTPTLNSSAQVSTQSVTTLQRCAYVGANVRRVCWSSRHGSHCNAIPCRIDMKWQRSCSSSSNNNNLISSNHTKGTNNNNSNSSNNNNNGSSTENSLLKQLKNQIRMTGPITVHQYMRAVLTHPKGGYYMDHDPLGEAGDFITSPEISQMFGELLGVWVFSEWHKMGQETPLQLVELGPGRGTLIKDILRSLQQLGLTGDAVHVHLVEISPHYRRLQRQTLCSSAAGEQDDPCELSSPSYTSSQTPVHWHQHLDSVPAGFSVFLAHEFFDALPIHKLVKTDVGKWKEVLIDINGDVGYGGYRDAGGVLADDSNVPAAFESGKTLNTKGLKPAKHETSETLNSMTLKPAGNETTSDAKAPKPAGDAAGASHEVEDLPLRYVLSRAATPATTIYTKDLEDRDMIEVCPDAALIAAQIATRITERGGALLVVDYGHSGSKSDTFRAFRRHRQQHPLLSPGSADLTADVDFSLLKKALPETVISFGPVKQGFFLKNMGIELRLLKLLQNCKSASTHASLVSSYRRLVEEMGGAFLVWAVYPRVMEKMLKKHPPPGFVRQLDEGWSSATTQRAEDIARKPTADENEESSTEKKK
ncbi:Protein arginine methyltransferase NDUFAF7 [Trinorchestia longiramus]|nr:Protein arginine methyltransferase NDUFAF7 [Trinorchestia longiramus]